MLTTRISVVVAIILLMGTDAWAFGKMPGEGTPLPEPQIGIFRKENCDNLERLKVGMSEKQVSDLMGDRKDIQTYNLTEKAEVLSNPVRIEARAGMDGKKRDIRYYYAYQKKADMKITTDELCPVVFKEGVMEGWGWEYYEKTIGPGPVGP